MEEFCQALVSATRNSNVPEDKDWFGPLIGSWDLDWNDTDPEGKPRTVKEEWIFARTLDGMAIQDVFIVPSRSERATNIHSDAEFGTTVRIYNPSTGKWDVFYGTPGHGTRLEAALCGERIVLTEVTERKLRWSFSEITPERFVWTSKLSPNGKEWKLMARTVGTRRK